MITPYHHPKLNKERKKKTITFRRERKRANAWLESEQRPRREWQQTKNMNKPNKKFIPNFEMGNERQAAQKH